MTTITLSAGEPYVARLHGGEFDGADRYVMAESDRPCAVLTMRSESGAPVEYEWNGFLAEGCGTVSAGYSVRRRA